MSESPPLLHAVLAECLEHYEHEGEAALEQACAAHPELAGEIRRRAAALLDLGLLAAAPGGGEWIPERLGEFRLLRRLGGGGMGVVYLAEQERLGRRVALKLLRPEQLFFPGARARFEREALAAARLQHPGIVAVHAVGEQDGVPFLAMEWVRGATLAQVIQALAGRPPQQLGGADLRQAILSQQAAEAEPGAATAEDAAAFRGDWQEVCLRLIREAAEALDHAHRRGVVHRDVKPSNIMVTPAGRGILLDFGLAQAEGVSRLTRSGAQLGSLPYMSPEQLRGESAGVRSDVYSLGVSLYELLTLELPYQAQSSEAARQHILAGRAPPPRRRNPALSWEAETVCLTAMAVEPAQRYASAEDFARDLGNVLEQRPIAARRPGLGLRARRWVQRNPAAAVALALGLTLAAGVPTLIAVQERAAGRRVRAQYLRAESNFDTAMEAVDRMLTRVAAERLIQTAQTESLRRAVYQDALEFYQGFLAQKGDDPRLRYETARAWRRAGDIRGLQGDLDGGVAAYEQALPLLQELDPEVPAHLEEIGLAQLGRGRWLGMGGEYGAAEPALAAAAATWEALVQAHPEQSRYRAQRGRSACALGVLLHNTGQRDAALQSFAAGLEDLAAGMDRSEAPHWQQAELAGQSISYARLLGLAGRDGEAEQAFARAAELLDAALAAAPAEPALRQQRARLAGSWSEAQARAGRLADAEGNAAQALALHQQLAADFPSETGLRLDLAVAYQRCADFARAQRRYGTAEEQLGAAAAILEALAAAAPDTVDHPRRLATAYSDLAQLLGDQGRTAEALERQRAAISILEKLAAQAPDLVELRRALGRNQRRLSFLLRADRQFEPAAAAARAALAQHEALAAASPELPSLQVELADSTEALATAWHEGGDLAAAWGEYRRAIAVRERLAAQFPERPEYASLAGNAYYNLTQLLRAQGNQAAEDPLAVARAALERQEQALRAAPAHPSFRARGRYARQSLAEALLEAGLLEEAAAFCAALPEFDEEAAANLRYAAGILARCANAGSGPAAEQAGSSAVELLRRAWQAGYPAAEDLPAAGDLSALRERADFQALLAEVQAGSPPEKP